MHFQGEPTAPLFPPPLPMPGGAHEGKMNHEYRQKFYAKLNVYVLSSTSRDQLTVYCHPQLEVDATTWLTSFPAPRAANKHVQTRLFFVHGSVSQPAAQFFHACC